MSKPIVLAGPSGAGKSTLLNKLLAEYPDKFGFSVSHTTRGPRPGEVDGREYFFTNRAEMEKEIAAGQFIETAEVHGNLYGTSFKTVDDTLSKGRVCILDVDIQGVNSIKKSKLMPVYIFVSPPSLELLEKRLRARGTETEENILKRLRNARKEMEARDVPGMFDHIIVNDDLETAYQQLKVIITPLMK